MMTSHKTKLQHLVEDLRADIRKGKYKVTEKFPSEYELADLYGINRITINKAVNILIQEGYLERASSTRAGTVVAKNHLFPEGIIGCITSLRDSFTSAIVAGAARIAERYNYVLSLTCPGFDELDETIRNMEAGKFKGIISIHQGKINTTLPIMYIDDDYIQNNSFSTLCDNYAGGRMIAECILTAGHRNIIYFTKVHSKNHTDMRRDGVVDVLKKYGIADAASRCFSCNENSMHHCILALKNICARYPDFSAIICNTDYLALNVIRAGQKLGLDIPGRISITGFGNVMEVQEFYNLTTIDQHPREMGIQACGRLISMIEGRCNENSRINKVDVELIVGNTVKNI